MRYLALALLALPLLAGCGDASNMSKSETKTLEDKMSQPATGPAEAGQREAVQPEPEKG